MAAPAEAREGLEFTEPASQVFLPDSQQHMIEALCQQGAGSQVEQYFLQATQEANKHESLPSGMQAAPIHILPQPAPLQLLPENALPLMQPEQQLYAVVLPAGYNDFMGSQMALGPGPGGPGSGLTPKPEHETSQAKRRGPMDEMRQLLRILVKILPQSLSRLPAGQEAGGGNRVTEQQIKSYLDDVLGDEAPRPEWGVRNGWGTYLAELLSWAVGREITSDQARNCVFRQQGRAWQIKEQALANLGIYAYSWPLPLTQPAVREANDNPGPPPQDTHYLPPPPGWPETAGVLPPISRSKQRASGAHTPPVGAAPPGPKLALPAPGSPAVAPTQPEPPRPRVQEPPEHTTTSSQPLCPIPSRSTGVHPALAETRQGAQSELGLLQGALEKIQQAAFLRIQNCMTPPSEEMQMVCMNIYTLITKQYLNDSDMPQPSGPGAAGGAQAAGPSHRQPIAPVVTRLGSPGKLPGSLKRSGSLPTSPAQVAQTGRQPLAASKLSRAPAAAPGPMLLDQLADVAAQHERQYQSKRQAQNDPGAQHDSEETDSQESGRQTSAEAGFDHVGKRRRLGEGDGEGEVSQPVVAMLAPRGERKARGGSGAADPLAAWHDASAGAARAAADELPPPLPLTNGAAGSKGGSAKPDPITDEQRKKMLQQLAQLGSQPVAAKSPSGRGVGKDTVPPFIPLNIAGHAAAAETLAVAAAAAANGPRVDAAQFLGRLMKSESNGELSKRGGQ